MIDLLMIFMTRAAHFCFIVAESIKAAAQPASTPKSGQWFCSKQPYQQFLFFFAAAFTAVTDAANAAAFTAVTDAAYAAAFTAVTDAANAAAFTAVTDAANAAAFTAAMQ